MLTHQIDLCPDSKDINHPQACLCMMCRCCVDAVAIDVVAVVDVAVVDIVDVVDVVILLLQYNVQMFLGELKRKQMENLENLHTWKFYTQVLGDGCGVKSVKFSKWIPRNL